MRRFSRRGQSVVEYVLVVSFAVVALAAGFLYLSDSTASSFQHARETVQLPYP